MVNVSDDLKSAFLTGRQKNLTLNFYKNNVLVDTLTPDAIVMESMEIQQLLCSEAQLTFGLCNAAEFRVQIFNGSVSHNGLIVKPVISTHDDNDVEYTFDLGIYKVVEDAVSDDRNTRTLTAYDALYDVVNNEYSEWYKSLTMPMTLKQFRDAFFSHIGITQTTINLPNDGMEIQKTIETNNLSGSAILKAILEINASFGFIDYTGTFRYTLWTEGTGLFPAEDLYPSPDLYPVGVAGERIGGTEESAVVLDTLVYADYVVREITGVLIQTTSTDEGTLVGTNANVYPILANFLLYDKSSSDLQTIGSNFLRYADQLYYRPSRFQVRCHPWVELGDFLSVNASSFRVTLPVLQRTITGITALYDEFEAQGSEIYTTQANNFTTMTENLYRKSLEIIKSVDLFQVEMHDELYGQNGVYSKISQSAHKIGLTITNSQDNTSAGIVIQLYDENGNPITQSGGNTGNINLTGLVSFNSIGTAQGTTFIDGGNIKTNTITAEKINTQGLIAENISASTITGKTITGSTLRTSATNSVNVEVTDNVVRFYRSGSTVGYITVDGQGNLLIKTSGQSRDIDVQPTGKFTYDGVEVATGNIPSVPDSTLDISADYNGRGIQFSNATSGTYRGATIQYVDDKTDSDRNLKEDIQDLADPTERYMRLRPVSFRFKDGVRETDEGIHYGLIAQEVDEDLQEVAHSHEGSIEQELCGDTYLRLKYLDLHAFHIKMIQMQQQRIDELEQKNAELEERLSRLEALLGRE